MKLLFIVFIFSLLTSLHAYDGVISWRNYVQDENYTAKTRVLRSDTTERLNGLNYLNTMRIGAGLIAFSANTLLDTATQNHMDYLIYNDLPLSHNEDNSTYPDGFTGVNSWERIGHVGYERYSSGENLSLGDTNIYDSIDGLMAAIYHRFGFLSFLNKDIGIGSSIYNVNSSVYTNSPKIFGFNMANTAWWETQELNPQYVLWPHNNYKNAQTSFNNYESPDPTPECPAGGITGNPISIEFNSIKNSAISMTSFKLFSNDGNEVSNTKDPTSVPNLDNNQFVLFPMDSLTLDSRYRAEFNYTEDTITKTISWYFHTRRYENKRYEVVHNGTYDIISGETYLIHLQHSDCNTAINSWGWNSSAVIEPINSDLYRITATSDTILNFNNDTFIINFHIAPTDSAIEPSESKPNIIPIINYLLF